MKIYSYKKGNNMKRIFHLLQLLCILFFLGACGDNGAAPQALDIANALVSEAQTEKNAGNFTRSTELLKEAQRQWA